MRNEGIELGSPEFGLEHLTTTLRNSWMMDRSRTKRNKFYVSYRNKFYENSLQ